MNKTEFLKQAMAKYKKAIETEFLSEMNFIFSDKLILRVWFDHEGKAKGEYTHRWCTVETLPMQRLDKIEDEIGRFVSHDEEDYPLIAKALKRALKTKPDAMLESINFKRGESITPIERLEFTYTVKAFCELVGIK